MKTKTNWLSENIASRRLTRQIKEWPWIGDVLLDASRCYGLKDYKIEEPAVRWFKTEICDDDIRKAIQGRVSEILDEMMKKRDPLLVNRLWIMDLVNDMAPWLVVTKNPNEEHDIFPDHPGFVGLGNLKYDAIVLGMPEIICEQYKIEATADNERVFALAEYSLQYKYWRNAYLIRFARIICSYIDHPYPDWFDRYLGVECAKKEEQIRESLRLPLPCEKEALLLEWYSVRDNLMERKVDPWAGVKMSQRLTSFA